MKTNRAKGFGRVFSYALVLACVSFDGGTASAAWTDGLVQYWDFSQGDPTKPANESTILDALTSSAATQVKAKRVDGDNPSDAAKALKVPAPVCYSNLNVQLPFYGNVTNRNRTCLWMPQETVMDGQTKKYFSREVRLPAPTTRANFGPVTIFMRFYLSTNEATSGVLGLYSYGGQYGTGPTTGWALALQNNLLSIGRGHTGSRLALVEVNGKKDRDQGAANAYLERGRWYDLVATADPTTDVDNINVYLCHCGKAYWATTDVWSDDYGPDIYHYRASYQIAPPAGDGYNIQILGSVEPDRWGGNEGTGWINNACYGQSVSGGFERLMVWNRILTEEEAYDAMADATGRNITIGVKNGSADEFGAAGTVSVAEVYDSATMPWNRMLKALSAAHPSLTVKFDVPTREAGLSRALMIDPLLTDVGTKVMMSLSVNGIALGAQDIAEEDGRTFFIPGKLVVPDADGKVTVVLTRTGDLTGTVGIDRLAFGGSWQIGAFDNSEPFLPANYRSTSRGVGASNAYVRSFLVDDRYSSQFVQTLSGTNSAGAGASNVPLTMRFEIPASLVDVDARLTLATKAESGTSFDYTKQSVTILVNGSPVTTITGLKGFAAQNTIRLPAGTFQAGMNVIAIINTTDVTSNPTYWGTSTPTIKFAAHRLEFKLRDGMLLIFR